jgi:ABC-type multidrug transport system fused ATPase/permease subunit
MTEIGERGINLSGGQKARVSLARAVYSQKQLYLLDDPLAAVDAEVAEHLFHECIQKQLRGKTRLLVTHQTQYLSQCDRVVYMHEGRVVASGTYDELLAEDARNGLVDLKLLGSSRQRGAREVVETEEGAGNKAAGTGKEEGAKGADEGKGGNAAGERGASSEEGKGAKDEERKVDGALTTKEGREKGAVKSAVLVKYFRAAGGVWVGVLLLILFTVGQLCKTASDVWLANWTSNKYDQTQAWYLAAYAVSCAVLIGVNLCRVFSFAYFTLVAAQTIHTRVFAKVLQGKMAFFDSTPIGRILNVFSGDIDLIDTKLPETAEKWFFLLLQIVISLAVIAAIIPWFLVALTPILVFFVVCTTVFRRAVRQFKRMDNITRSPLLAHFGSTMHGLLTIRAYGQHQRFVHEHEQLCNETARTYLAFYVTNRWIGFR